MVRCTAGRRLLLCAALIFVSVAAATQESTKVSAEKKGDPASEASLEPLSSNKSLSSEILGEKTEPNAIISFVKPSLLKERKKKSFWKNKFFRKFTRLFDWKKNKKFQKRISGKRIPGYLPAKRKRYPYKKVKYFKVPIRKSIQTRVQHPYEFVYSKSSHYKKSKPSYLKSLSDSYDNKLSYQSPKFLNGFDNAEKKNSVGKITYSQSKMIDFKKPSIQQRKSEIILKSPIIQSRVPVISRYASGNIYNVPANSDGLSISVGSEVSFEHPTMNTLKLEAKNLKRKQNDNLLDNISDFTSNIFNTFLPNPFSSKDKIRNKRRDKRPKPIPVKISSNFSPKQRFQSHGFVPSPKEGSIMADAFQPIFVPSQSLDNSLEDVMKPMIIPQARRRISQRRNELTPPKIIDFI